ncbi:hypothetical protein CAPTEDRAFT_124737 [Capitella teleta]|uniref:Uncharacterized protein n=1 Tax=Capitella teleta TaxID=283909 RepID=R7UH32_CAPTE|nr:hypothetical protein CAPTEDRAFT_124737 [Capitella teleta]|eukprot:ELU05403.1 hypothetical protein CAPTEDRAFT_124737 [Capitella teleta]
MNSLRNVHIAHFLLEQGASLNAQDWIGNTALHYAIHNDRADAVELLLQYGADPRIQNEQGDDAFRTVSLLGKPAILNVLIQHSWADVSIQCQIESHELMGATFVDGMGDIQGALNEWNNAMLMRRKHKMMLSSDDVIPPRSVYGKQVEAITFEKFLPLEYTCDHERIHNQSLLIRERLLGLEHIATFSALLKRAASLADHRKYKRAAHTWCYAAKLRHHHGDRVAKDVIGAAQSMCTMFIEMDEEYMFDGADDYFCYKDAYSVFRVLCDEVEAAFQADATNQRDQPFCILVRYTLHLMSLLMNVSSKDEDVVFMRRVKQLVQKDVRLRDGSTMLHMAMDPFSNQLGKADKSYFPSDSIAELLLSCGANVNARDDRGNTPLHWFMDRLAATADLEPYVAMMLIDQGAHLDARNVDGVLACDPLRRIPEFQNQIPHKNAMGLKCLAARAIRAHNIPYMSEVPEALHEFIALH